MFKRSRSDVPRYSRGGLTSHVLLQRGDLDGSHLTVTWVEVEPGGAQRPHAHPPEQVYIVVHGQGRMHVGNDTQAVERGDLVHIPPETEHYAENTGEDVLTYISAATPNLDATAFYTNDPAAPPA